MLNEIAGQVQAIVQGGDAQGHRTAFGIRLIHACAVGDMALDRIQIPASDGRRQESRRAATGVVQMAGQCVGRALVVYDMKNELVAEESVWVLNLEQMESGNGQSGQLNEDRLLGLQGHGARHASAIDEQTGVLAEVAAAQLHARMAGVQDRKLLATALFLNGTSRPQSGLRVVCVNLSAEASRECSDEMPPSRHRDQVGA